MQKTTLSPTATPGIPYDFTPADPGEDRGYRDPVTTLSPTATPGGRYNFVAKTAVTEPVVPQGPVRRVGGGGWGFIDPSELEKKIPIELIAQDDEEVFEMITTLFNLGVFDA